MIKDITIDMFPTKITFVYGANKYSKFVLSKYGIDNTIYTTGTTLILTNNSKHDIVIGVIKLKNIYQLKAIIVHELSHAVTEIMKNIGSECDEVRSYMLQRFYEDIMPVLDEELLNKLERKKMACSKKKMKPSPKKK